MKTYTITNSDYSITLQANCGIDAMVRGFEMLRLFESIPSGTVPMPRCKAGEAGCFPVVDCVTNSVLFTVTQC